jgi:group I intron endonuclease
LYTVYCATNRVNGKVYVGKTGQSLHRRFNNHLNYSRRGGKTHFCFALQKYGLESFEIRELATGANKNGADCLEKMWVAALQANNRCFGYNGTSGGDGCPGYVPTPEHRAKIGAKARGRKLKPLTEAQKANISLKLRGRKRPPHIVELLRNRVFTPEHRARISAANLGRKFSPEVRANMSAGQKNRLPPSAETIAKRLKSYRQTLKKRHEAS